MGSPISGILAEVKFRKLEEAIRSKFKSTDVLFSDTSMIFFL